jgi:hypothetical protein
MVTARAPARALGDMFLRVTSRNGANYKPIKLERPDSSVEQLDVSGAVTRRLPTLSPATRRMLDGVRLALTIEASPERGYHFRGAVSRAEIAAALQKDRLVPYDVEKLNKLVAAHLMVEDYRALPVKKMIGADGQELQLGAGGEYIYHIPPKILYALVVIDDPGAFSVLNPRAEAEAVALHERAKRDADNSASAAAYVERINKAAPALYTPIRRPAARRGWFNQPTWVYVALALLAVGVFVGTWMMMGMLMS